MPLARTVNPWILVVRWFHQSPRSTSRLDPPVSLGSVQRYSRSFDKLMELSAWDKGSKLKAALIEIEEDIKTFLVNVWFLTQLNNWNCQPKSDPFNTVNSWTEEVDFEVLEGEEAVHQNQVPPPLPATVPAKRPSKSTRILCLKCKNGLINNAYCNLWIILPNNRCVCVIKINIVKIIQYALLYNTLRLHNLHNFKWAPILKIAL